MEVSLSGRASSSSGGDRQRVPLESRHGIQEDRVNARHPRPPRAPTRRDVQHGACRPPSTPAAALRAARGRGARSRAGREGCGGLGRRARLARAELQFGRDLRVRCGEQSPVRTKLPPPVLPCEGGPEPRRVPIPRALVSGAAGVVQPLPPCDAVPQEDLVQRSQPLCATRASRPPACRLALRGSQPDRLIQGRSVRIAFAPLLANQPCFVVCTHPDRLLPVVEGGAVRCGTWQIFEVAGAGRR
ncbi:hypothetical protein T484DRAFT_1961439 [Baffinella frigidus]|nr:hypothetical protein T484DRAFT_1961439 [Cryptophyta sp. CCMP2293]